MLGKDEFTYEELRKFERGMEEYRHELKKTVSARVFNLPDGDYEVIDKNVTSRNGECSLRFKRVD